MSATGRQLPAGWRLATIGSVCSKPQYGWTTSAAVEGTIRLLRTTDITHGPVDWSTVPFCKDLPPEVDKYLLAEGDIVVSRAGSVGASCRVIAPERSVFASYLIRFRPSKAVDGHYLSYVLQSPEYWAQVRGNTSGIAIPNVNASKLAGFTFSLPPLGEQRRIVEDIETQFTRLDAGVAALRRVQANLKRYRAAVLKAACEGRLVPPEAELARQAGRPGDFESGEALLARILEERRRSWKGKGKYKEPVGPEVADLPKLPEGWVWARLEQLGLIFGGLTKNPKRLRLPQQLPYLRVANVHANELRLEEVEHIGVHDSELEKLLLKAGDLLIVEGNGSKAQIGRLAVWDGSIDPCVHQNHIIKVRIVIGLLPNWILHWLQSPHGRKFIELVASSTSGLYTLSVNKVGDLPIALPPLAEQLRIVTEAERRLSVIEDLERVVTDNLQRAARLRQSILQNAFMGALIPA